MTNPEPSELRDELRRLRETIEDAIRESKQTRRDMARIERKSDQRVRRITVAFVAFAVVLIGGGAAGYIGYRSDARHLQCFEDWANRTADRTASIAQASDRRIQALNDALQSRARGDDEATVRMYAARAAQAGEAYELVVKDHPPVPAAAINCNGTA